MADKGAALKAAFSYAFAYFEKGVSLLSIQNEALVAVVRDRLLCDRRIAAQAIDVSCSDGFVCLVGLVDTHEQRRIAVQLVTGLIGVRNVRDELVVRGSTPTTVTPTSPRVSL